MTYANNAQRVNNLYTIHKKLSTICAKMHTRGVYFIEENRACMEYMLIQEIEEAKVNWRNIVGIPDTIPCTPNSMRAAIFTRHRKAGIPCLEMPDPVNIPDFTNPSKETISIKKSPLLRLIVSPHATPEVIKVVDAWWRFKKAEKKLGYVQSKELLELVNPEDNRYRPNWNSCGTDTGRFTGGTFMTTPQDLRYMFGCAPGRAKIHVDKKQLEIRVMACVANDRTLQSLIKSGADLYEAEARRYFKIPDGTPVKKALRQGAKIVRLARQYGAMENAVYSQAIASDRTMTISRTRALMNLFDTTYCDTVQYWKDETVRVAKTGYSEDRLHGRRRVYPRMPDPAEIANWPVQATAAAIMNEELIELDARLTNEWPDAFIEGQQHDALDIDCDEDDIEPVCKIVKEVTDRTRVINGIEFHFGIDLKIASHEYMRHGPESKGDTWASV